LQSNKESLAFANINHLLQSASACGNDWLIDLFILPLLRHSVQQGEVTEDQCTKTTWRAGDFGAKMAAVQPWP